MMHESLHKQYFPSMTLNNIIKPNMCDNYCLIKNDQNINNSAAKTVSFFLTRLNNSSNSFVHVLRCKVCDYSTLNLMALKEHYQLKHVSSIGFLSYSCSQCACISTEKSLMEEHLKLYHRITENLAEKLVERFHNSLSNDSTTTSNPLSSYTLSSTTSTSTTNSLVLNLINAISNLQNSSVIQTRNENNDVKTLNKELSSNDFHQLINSKPNDLAHNENVASSEVQCSGVAINNSISGSRRRKTTTPGRIYTSTNNMHKMSNEDGDDADATVKSSSDDKLDEDQSLRIDLKRPGLDEIDGQIPNQYNNKRSCPDQSVSSNDTPTGTLDPSFIGQFIPLGDNVLCCNWPPSNPTASQKIDPTWVWTNPCQSNGTSTPTSGALQPAWFVSVPGLVDSPKVSQTNDCSNDISASAAAAAATTTTSVHLQQQQTLNILEALKAIGINNGNLVSLVNNPLIVTENSNQFQQVQQQQQLTNNLTANLVSQLLRSSQLNTPTTSSSVSNVTGLFDQLGLNPLTLNPTNHSGLVNLAQLIPSVVGGSLDQMPKMVKEDAANTGLVDQALDMSVHPTTASIDNSTSLPSSTAYELKTDPLQTICLEPLNLSNMTEMLHSVLNKPAINNSTNNNTSPVKQQRLIQSIEVPISSLLLTQPSPSAATTALNTATSAIEQTDYSMKGMAKSAKAEASMSTPAQVSSSSGSLGTQLINLAQLQAIMTLLGQSSNPSTLPTSVGLASPTSSTAVSIQTPGLFISMSPVTVSTPTAYSHTSAMPHLASPLITTPAGLQQSALGGNVCGMALGNQANANNQWIGSGSNVKEIAVSPGMSLTGIFSNNLTNLPSTALSQLSSTLVGNPALVNLFAPPARTTPPVSNKTPRLVVSTTPPNPTSNPSMPPALKSARSVGSATSTPVIGLLDTRNGGLQLRVADPCPSTLFASNSTPTDQFMAHNANTSTTNNNKLSDGKCTESRHSMFKMDSTFDSAFADDWDRDHELFGKSARADLDLINSVVTSTGSIFMTPTSTSTSSLASASSTFMPKLISPAVHNHKRSSYASASSKHGSPSFSASSSGLQGGASRRSVGAVGGESGGQLRSHRQNFTPAQNQILTEWYHKHQTKPYPSTDDTKELSIISGLSYSQVKKWFANKRARSTSSGLPKPTPPLAPDSSKDPSATRALVAAAMAAANSSTTTSPSKFKQTTNSNDSQPISPTLQSYLMTSPAIQTVANSSTSSPQPINNKMSSCTDDTDEEKQSTDDHLKDDDGDDDEDGHPVESQSNVEDLVSYSALSSPPTVSVQINSRQCSPYDQFHDSDKISDVCCTESTSKKSMVVSLEAS